MAEPTEGTYLVINANSLKALDVRGASDKAGTNVQQWSVNSSDAQIWAVTEQTGGWQLLCSLTGKCLDVAGGSIKSGTNVQQWSDNNGRAQRWEFEDTGETLSYGGAEYPVWRVAIAANTSLVLAVSGSSTADSANVILYARTSGAGQRWILVPVPALTQGGPYELVPAVSQSVRVDISGGSKANGANAQVWSANGGNAQKFEAVVDPQTMLCTLLNVGSGKALAVAGSGSQAGVNVLQWEANGSMNQSWLPVQAGTMRVNGNNVPTYQLRLQGQNGLCLDVCGGKSALKTNVQVWQMNGSAAQKFHLMKTEVEGTTLPAPTRLSPSRAHGRGAVSVTPTFESPATAWQVRMRTVAHDAQDGTTTSLWQSLADGSTARDGWGEAWEPTFEAAAGTVALPVALSAELSPACPRVDVEVQVRVFSPSWGATRSKAHGPVAASTVTLALDPTVTCGGVSLDLSGEPALAVALSSDVPRDANHVTVALRDAWGLSLCAPVAGTIARSGAVMVPVASLLAMPADGDALAVEVEWETEDGGMFSGTLEASADMGSGTVAATVADGPNLTDVVSCEGASVWLAVERGDGTELVPAPSDGVLHFVCPPLNVPYVLYVATADGVTSIPRPPKESRACRWAWGERWSRSASIEVQRGGRPSQAMSWDPDVAVLQTSGRAHPIATAGRSSALDLSVSGWVDGSTEASQASFEELASALGRGMVPVYRSVRGDWHRVAVTGVDLGFDGPDGNSVKVTQQAVTP